LRSESLIIKFAPFSRIVGRELPLPVIGGRAGISNGVHRETLAEITVKKKTKKTHPAASGRVGSLTIQKQPSD
jgi:hypothetical protein